MGERKRGTHFNPDASKGQRACEDARMAKRPRRNSQPERDPAVRRKCFSVLRSSKPFGGLEVEVERYVERRALSHCVPPAVQMLNAGGWNRSSPEDLESYRRISTSGKPSLHWV